ncbi:partitioning defective 3 homolog isoform X5 [Eriocheir sinensis]|uniref:partitioning defective 3 homolog isoform X5 n=1 Tax=Eriocheir sinensis TaxID=95602 RepID=UPI0021C77375|nr:partitioning defective 3 homolog isoform X5 [Eriocheir sinensis]
MRMRSRSVAAAPPSLAVTVGGNTGASRSLLNLPGELKVHYSEVVNVAEKLTRFFSRSHSYNVHKHHKTLALPKKPSHSWVTVHNLKQLDGGILDPDDRLNDVADDREQIIALYEEQPSLHQGGDGTSASSDSENPSPDIFQDVEHKFSPFTRNDIEITGEELSGAPPPLHVRRGSEPALNRLSPIPPVNVPPDPTKRWSAAPIIEDQNPALSSSTPMKTIQDGHSSYEDDSVFVDPGERGEGSGEEKTPSSSTSSHHSSAATAFTRFNRDTNRCSVQVLSDNPIMARWADAADSALASSEGRRREPLGGSASSPLHFRDSSHEDSNTILVVLSNDRGPLGIHVIPSTDGRGRDQGLLVEGVEPAGRIARDGRIQVHDRIIEINGRSLSNITFQNAQEIFKDAMQSPELRLLVVKGSVGNHQRQGSCTELVEGEERTVGGAKVASVTATRKVGGASLSSRTQAVILQSNTRKLGRRVTVHLTKGPHGLGFSITTRDNPAGGEAPIYIKNILPKGAAIEDGTLRIGDRLLEVNGVAVTGNSQSEVAGLLRQIPIGGTATLIVSRQDQRGSEGASIDSTADEKPSSPLLPRQLPLEKSPEDSLQFPWKHKEILVFEIPVHDSERAGLGVSVKGKTTSGPNGAVDLGIFVKNVIHGGAASRDGRLLQNDQLVNINGLSLLGKPNSEAMKTLRTAMHQEVGAPESARVPFLMGPTPGMISLTVARRTDLSRERSSPSSANRSGRDSANSLLTNSSGTETLGGTKSAPTTPTPDHSGTTDASDATLVFHVNNKSDERLHPEREFINDTFDVRNPVIQRLTNNNGALRNESYYKATHETWNTSQLQQLVMRVDRESLAPAVGGSNTLGSPTVNLPSRDTLIIHDDTGTHLSGHMSGHGGPGASAGSLSDHPSQSDDAYTSQTSLEENAAGFSRDQFGRQSMSEKRHATLDAKNTDTYQRNKKAREEREKQKQIMLAQEKLAATQGLGAAGMAGGPVEEVNPGLREVGIDVPPTEPPSGAPHPSPLAPPAGRPVPNTSCWGRTNKAKDENKPPKNKNKSVQGTKPSTKQQFMQGLRGPGLRRGSEPVGATLRRGQSGGHPRGTFSPTSRSLERHYSKGNQRTTFGQDLSNMISNWASRNQDLLGREALVAAGKMVRASSDESLASQTQRTTHAHQPSSPHEHVASQDALRSRLDFGPGLGMKKSSSLESLQTMVQEMTMEEEGHRMGSGRVPRGRGCNESFRAAVDRSYDVPLNGLRSKMETLAEEESESSGSGFGRGNSRQSSVNSAVEDKNKKIGKKKAGLLKGLGSMFRFGKHRKSVDNTNSGPGRGDREGEREGRGEMDRAEVERLAAVRRLQQEEHDHMQEQYRRLIENTARSSQQQQQMRGEDGEPSRSERMHQLRAEHQRRHAQRNRTYPTDDMEEHYESAIRQMLDERGHLEADKANNNTLNPTDTKLQRLEPVPNEPRPEVRHVRSHSYDLYGDGTGSRQGGEATAVGGRPGSRTAYADPHTYSHYVNYEQIQQHLRKNKEQERLKKLASQQYQDFRDKQTSREAREYQSQRGPRDSARESHHRPVSNYYEYESVQAMISHAQDSSSTSLPRRHQPPPPPPGAKNNEGIGSLHPGVSQPHHLTMYKPGPSTSIHTNQSGRSSGMPGASHGQPSSYQSQGEKESHRVDGVYSSGYRPASHYTGPHHKPPPPPPHHSTKITVPGSKV